MHAESEFALEPVCSGSDESVSSIRQLSYQCCRDPLAVVLKVEKEALSTLRARDRSSQYRLLRAPFGDIGWIMRPLSPLDS